MADLIISPFVFSQFFDLAIWLFLGNSSFLTERGSNVWNLCRDKKVYKDMQQMYFSPSIIIFVNIHRSPADVSFIYNRQDPRSPRILVQRSLSLQLPLQSCYCHASFLPTNLLELHFAKHWMVHPGPGYPAYLLSRQKWKTGVCLGGGMH